MKREYCEPVTVLLTVREADRLARAVKLSRAEGLHHNRSDLMRKCIEAYCRKILREER